MRLRWFPPRCVRVCLAATTHFHYVANNSWDKSGIAMHGERPRRDGPRACLLLTGAYAALWLLHLGAKYTLQVLRLWE